MLTAVVAGALLGVLLGTVGGGGAVLAVPVLVYLLGQGVHAATTESLVIVLAAATAGAVAHARHGAVCWRLAAAFAAAAVPASVAGTLANQAVAAERLLAAFAGLLLLVAVVTWRRAAGVRLDGHGAACPALRLGVVAAAGAATGLLTGLFGVGGGFAVVPALALVLHVPLRRAIATSLVIVSAVSAVGLTAHLAAAGHVSWDAALPFAASAMLTASFGGAIAARVPRMVLARGFSVLVASVAAYLIVAIVALGGPPHG